MQSMRNDRLRTFSDNFSQWQPATGVPPDRSSSLLFPMLHLYPHTQHHWVLFAGARHKKYKNIAAQSKKGGCVNGPGKSQCSLTLTGASGNPTGADKNIHRSKFRMIGRSNSKSKQCVKPPHGFGFCRDRIHIPTSSRGRSTEMHNRNRARLPTPRPQGKCPGVVFGNRRSTPSIRPLNFDTSTATGEPHTARLKTIRPDRLAARAGEVLIRIRLD